MQFEAPLAGTELFIPGFKVDGTNSYFRVANASTWTTTITARLYNNSGSQVGSTYTDSVNNQKAKSFVGNVFGAASGTYTLRIQSTYNVTAAAWHSSGGGHTGVSAQRIGDTDGTWTLTNPVVQNGTPTQPVVNLRQVYGVNGSIATKVRTGVCARIPSHV